MSQKIAEVIRGIRAREVVSGKSVRPSGVMIDYDDLEHYFNILDIHRAPDLREGRSVTIHPNSTVGRNIVHLTRSGEETA